ncbi:hypothetical protein IFM12276_38850 [Nocardia sputorum]|uniref:YcaO domain-containing protein n=1 Tax=Nocardia sputorum TaxID=2984338 RepID=A0ABN6U6G3_9NOCA|nr:hypothetical protein IFM12276_38850 [Nocardia sputorum]
MLRLRRNAFYTAADDRLAVLSHRGFVTRTVPDAEGWMTLLAPLLDGHNTLRDITQPFPQQHRCFAEKLISLLVDLGVVQQKSADDPYPDDPEADLIGYSVADPTAALAVLRGAPTVVIGTSPLAEAAAAALRDSDIETTCIDPAALETVQFSACNAVACLAITDVGRIAAVEQWCLRRNAPLVLAALGQSSVWIAPPGVTFTEVRPRLDAIDSAAPLADYAAAALAAVAAYLARTLIQCATTIDDGSTDRRLARIDTETLATTTHRYLPFRRTPRPPDPESFLRRLATARSTASLQDADFARRAVGITDDRVGVISTVSEGPYAQLPLRVAESVVADPAGEIQTKIRAFGVGKNTASARLSAARAALRTSAALAAPRDGSVFGYSLDDRTPVAMSAATAFEIAAMKTTYGLPVGTAYGDSLDQAVLAGLLDHCRSITVSTVRGRAGYLFPEIDAAAFVGALGRYCLSALEAMRVTVQLFALTEVLGAPVVAVLVDGVTLAYGCGVDLAGAVEDGIITATVCQQSLYHDEPDYRPAPVPELPTSVRGTRGEPPRAAVRQGELVRSLHARGYTSSFVLLDDDPWISAIMPHVVRVIVRKRS